MVGNFSIKYKRGKLDNKINIGGGSMSDIEKFQKIIDKSKKIVFFGGAGVSTESGIPDFRSAEGLFMQESDYQYAPEQIISHSFFKEHPEIFFKYYFENLVYEDAKPNSTHLYLAELETKGKDVSIVTQNIDGLHQKAGSTKVYELHGSVLKNYCLECGENYTLDELQKDEKGVPRCPKEGAIIRPDVTLYEEQLNKQVMNQALVAIRDADLLIVAGTSLSVYPAAGMIDWFDGDELVVINKTPVKIYQSNALFFQQSLADVFLKLT